MAVSAHLARSRIILAAVVFACFIMVICYWNNVKTIKISHLGQERPADKKPCQGSPIPCRDILDQMTHKQVAQIYHSYINTIQIPCNKSSREGNAGDGGWNVCHDGNYVLKKPCIVYSFGINWDFSFDDAIATKYGCEVHSFDPSMSKAKDHDRKPNLHFHKTGLSSTNTTTPQGWRMRTLKEITKELHHTQSTIDLLKIDVDYGEWQSFPEMLRSGVVRQVKQFCFEIHIKLKTQPEPDAFKYKIGLDLLRNIYNEGFRIFRADKNMDAKYKSTFGMERTGCHELYMLRSNIHTC